MADQIKWITPDNLVCPTCDYPLQVHRPTKDSEVERPEPDAVTLCANCATPAFFFDLGHQTLGLRQPRRDEWVDLIADEQIAKARAAVIFKRATEWGAWPGS